LPAVEASYLNDLVNVIDDVLDDDRRVAVLDAVKELSESSLSLVLLFLGHDFLFGGSCFFGEVDEHLEELDAVDETLLVTFPQVLQALAELLELAILIVPADSGDEIYLQLTRDLLGIALVVDEVLDHVLVELKDVVIVSDSLDGDVLVHELDCLGPERCPDELPAIVYRSHGIVDLREPDEIGLVGIETCVGRKGFPRSVQDREVGPKLVFHLCRWQALLSFEKGLPIRAAAVSDR